jgi:transcriptional regulator with XRE-family HTH domain
MLKRPPDPKSVRTVFAERLRELRESRHLNQQQLATRLDEEFDIKLDRTAIAKIENGDRNVSIEDAVAFAAALNVSPIMLMSPRGTEPAIAIGSMSMTADQFRDWARGNLPAPLRDPKGRLHESEAREFHETMSDLEYAARDRLPSLPELKQLVFNLQFIAGTSRERTLLSRFLNHIDTCVSHLRDEVKKGDRSGTR